MSFIGELPAQHPLRVSLLTTYAEQCGVAVYSEALAEALAQHNVAVSIIAPRLRDADTPRGEQPARVWRRDHAGLLDAWQTFQQVRRQRPDAVHVQVTMGIVS